MALPTLKICEDEFRRVWEANELSRTDMAIYFNCSVSSIDYLRVKLGLGKRKRTPWRAEQVIPDPTPEEIAQRARECRERHFAEKLREPDVPTCRGWRQTQRAT